MTNQTTDAATRTRNRASLLLIFALFAAPVVVAWLLFFVFPQWVPTSTSNHGTLVKPVRPLPPFHLPTLSGDTVEGEFLQGKWTFVYLHSGDCDKACVQQLYKMRQVRLTQGKNIDRLQRLMLWDAGAVEAVHRKELQQHFPGQVTAIVSGPAAQPLLSAFAIDRQAPLQGERLYLVDPLGNLMMMYAPEDEPRGMIKDLERLLKYSGLG
jgi:cytochrome oxidase Cu insertion factor (SCO1/SenC/PrrC family)